MNSDPLKFIVDRDLFPLCKTLRLLGFDAEDRGSVSLQVAVRRAVEERRVWIRKSNQGLQLQYGIRYFLLQSEQTSDQLQEIAAQYPIPECSHPFSRCLKCNQILQEIAATELGEQVPEKVLSLHQSYCRCPNCGRIYWQGSHVHRMLQKLESWGWKNLRVGDHG